MSDNVEQFRESVADSNYPFAASSTIKSLSGRELSPSLILDANICLPSSTVSCYLQKIVTGLQKVTVTVSDVSNKYTATGDIEENNDTVQLIDEYGRKSGLLVVSDSAFAVLRSWPRGEHIFDKQATQFVPSCVFLGSADVVNGFLLPDKTLVSGRVFIIAGRGVRFVRQDDNPEPVDPVVKLHVIGDPYYKYDDPEEERPTFITRINNVGPNSHGSFTLDIHPTYFNSAISVITENDQIKISLAGSGSPQ